MTTHVHTSRRPSPTRANAIVGASAAALVLLSAGAPASGQCADWRTRGAGMRLGSFVNDSTTWDPDGAGPQPPMLVVAGRFSHAGVDDGVAARNIAAWDGAQWRAFGPGLGDESQQVAAVTVYNGQLIAAGTFTFSGSEPISRIARWDGTAWRPLAGGINGGTAPSVSALAVYDGELIAAGLFTTAGAQTANSIARWNGTTWNTLGDGIQVTHSLGVRAMTVYNGQLIVAGAFAFAGDQVAFNIARWNGVWSPMGDIFGDAAVNEVLSLTVFDNALIAAGRFSEAGGVSTRNIARWNGFSWSPLGTGIQGGGVYDVGVYNGELVATGLFNSAGGAPANSIARWNGTTWRPLGAGINNSGHTLTTFNNNLIVGGAFYQAGSAVARGLASWNGADWSALHGVFIPATGDGVRTITPWAGSVVHGGYHFTTDTNEPQAARALTAWDGRSLRSLGNPTNVILASASIPVAPGVEDLVIGGKSGVIDGMNFNSIARRSSLPGSTWENMGDGFNGDVHAITYFNGQVYAAGDFTHSGATPLDHIARWDGSSWQPAAPGVAAGLNGPAYCMKPFQSGPTTRSLIVGGDFTSVASVNANRIALLNITDAQVPSWTRLGSGFNAPVRAVEYYNGSIYAAGDFNTSGTTTVNHIARWNGSAWEPVGPGLDGPVHAMTVSNGTLVVGGDFNFAGGVRVDRLARWNGQEWTRVGGGADNSVYALCAIGNEIHVGGTFSHVRLGALESPLWARFSEDGIPWFNRHPDPANVNCFDTASFTIEPAIGYGGLSYQWRRNGVNLTNGPTGTGSTIVTNGVSLHILNAGQADAGTYDCVLSNGCGSSTSNPAMLTVVGDCGQCAADFNHDGFVNSQDLFDFLTAFFSASPSADFNHDGLVNSQDFFDFLVAFFAGCQ